MMELAFIIGIVLGFCFGFLLGGVFRVIRLKQRLGPITDLRTKRLLETTASLMSTIGQHHRGRIMTKAKRWKLTQNTAGAI